MWLKRSKEFPGSVEGTVRFDEETLCALEHGLDKNPEVAKELEEIVGQKAKIFRDILSNTLNPKQRAPIQFVPNEEARTFYSQISKRELERIDAEDEEDEDLTCGHSVDEHRRVLKVVVEKMQPTVN